MLYSQFSSSGFCATHLGYLCQNWYHGPVPSISTSLHTSWHRVLIPILEAWSHVWCICGVIHQPLLKFPIFVTNLSFQSHHPHPTPILPTLISTGSSLAQLTSTSSSCTLNTICDCVQKVYIIGSCLCWRSCTQYMMAAAFFYTSILNLLVCWVCCPL